MMKILILLFLFLSACSNQPYRDPSSIAPQSGLKLRFQIDPKDWNEGVRVAEFRTGDIDVTYKILKADADLISFKVYVSNIGKKKLTVDSSLFHITSLNSRKLYTASTSYWADEKTPVAKVSLAPGESASSELKFAVNDSAGRWTLKNKITPHAFNFMVGKL
jgi:hypothetical protein